MEILISIYDSQAYKVLETNWFFAIHDAPQLLKFLAFCNLITLALHKPS